MSIQNKLIQKELIVKTQNLSIAVLTKTAVEYSGPSSFKDTCNNGNDAPVNSHTLEQQEGCLANNVQAASNIDG